MKTIKLKDLPDDPFGEGFILKGYHGARFLRKYAEDGCVELEYVLPRWIMQIIWQVEDNADLQARREIRLALGLKE